MSDVLKNRIQYLCILQTYLINGKILEHGIFLCKIDFSIIKSQEALHYGERKETSTQSTNDR